MVTIYDIAKKVGCASSTVSRALNSTRHVSPPLKREIERVAKELGYVANVTARNLISNESRSIGVIYHESLEIGLEHQHFGGILQSFKTYVEQMGYEITFVSRKAGMRELTYLEWCKSRRIVGILIVTIDDKDEQLIELIESDIPVVSVNKVDLNCPAIISNNEQGTLMAMEYFLQNNKKRIAHISLPESSFSGKERCETYKKFMYEQFHEKNEPIVITASNYKYEDGYDAGMKLIKNYNSLPEALYAGSDMLAIGAIRALIDSGYKVPEDIEVIGFDDIEIARYITPALTTIAQDKYRIGVEAGKLLISFITEEEEKQKNLVLRIPVSLIVRDSTQG